MMMKMWRCATLGVLAGLTVVGTAQAAPQRRGPVIEVIRPDADTFPLRARTEARGPIRLADVVADAWVGPRLADQWGPSASATTTARSWVREDVSEWEQLKAERDVRFEGGAWNSGYR